MRGRWVAGLLIAACVLLAGRAIAGDYADGLWYASLGAGALWRERVWLGAVTRVGSGLAAALFVFLNLYGVRESVVKLVLPRRVANIEIGEEVPGRTMVLTAAVLAVLFGWLLALPAETWQKLAMYQHGIPFGEADPYLENDLGFYVYRLPFETSLYVTSMLTVLMTVALVVFLYALTPGLRWEAGRLKLSQYVRRHLLVLGAVLLVILAWSFRLDEFRTMFAGSGVGGAFSYVDHKALIPAAGVLSLISLGAAFLLLVLGWMGQSRFAVGALSVLLLIGVSIRSLAPILVQRSAVIADAAMRDQPYQRERAEYSRRAFAVDRIRAANASLRFGSPRAAAVSVSAWDPSVLVHAASRRRHGEVASVGWTARRGSLVAVVPVRTPPPPRDSAAATWTLTSFLASFADGGGDLIAADDSGGDELLPSVLVYEGAPEDMLVMADTFGVIPAPALTTTGARIAFAWSRQRLGLISAELPGPRPQAIVLRDLRERVDALVPFFQQGTAAVPMFVSDSLYWALDLYSVSETYPLSRRDSLGDGEFSFIHHAATAIVNAHTGRVLLIADAVLDPLAKSWVTLFPSLFADRTSVPRAILAALPPEADGARVQARMLARYGRRGESPPGGDLPPALADSIPAAHRDGSYLLPQGQITAWSVPLLDANEHLSGIAIATGGEERATYWMPIAGAGARWSTVTGQLKSALDSALSPVTGVRVTRGAVRAVPVANGVLFEQSAYGWRADAPPTLLRAALTDGSVVASGRSVSLALGAPPIVADSAPATPAAFRARVNALYGDMRAAMRRGDWPAFGRAFEALGALLGHRERQP